jgi:hypothetical protein
VKWVGENCMMSSFITFTFHQYNWNDQVKDDEVNRTCSTNGVEEERIY